MSMIEIPLSEVGLLTVAHVAARLGRCTARSVQNWIADGLLPVVIASSGRRSVFLVREKDLASFTRPTRGRPVEIKISTLRVVG